MSVKVTSRVWETSQQSGAALLLLLALADFSDDDGYSFPEIPALAGKARVTDRGAKGIIAHLERSGEIAVNRGAGRGIRSVYRVLSGLKPADIASTDFGVFKNARVKAPKKVNELHPSEPEKVHGVHLSEPEKVKMTTGKGEDDCIALRKNHQGTVNTGLNQADGGSGSERGVVPADAGTAAAPSASGVVEAAWAKRTTGLPRRKPARTPTEQQQFFEAVASACGMDPAFMAEADRANVGRLASRLRADPEIDLAFVADCAAAWGSQFPGRATADVRPPSVGQFTTWIGRRKAARLPQARPSAEF